MNVKNILEEQFKESREWLVGPDGRIIESSARSLDTLNNNISSIPKHEADAFLKEHLMKFIQSLKSNK